MTTIFIIVLLVIGGAYFSVNLMASNNLRKRKLLKFEEIYSELSDSIGEQDVIVVRDALRKIEQIFSIPLGYLRPTDEFGKDLGRRNILSTVDSNATENLYLYISEKAKSAAVSDFVSIRTVSDFVLFEVRIANK